MVFMLMIAISFRDLRVIIASRKKYYKKMRVINKNQSFGGPAGGERGE